MRIFASLSAWNTTSTAILSEAIEALEPLVDGFHWDSMDGIFVSAVWGDTILMRGVRSATGRPFWYHLMACDYEKRIQAMPLCAGDWVSIHYEAIVPLCCRDDAVDRLPHTCAVALHRFILLCDALRSKGIMVGIALCPQTPLMVVEPLIAQLDHIVVMGVAAGRSGQPMLPDTQERLREAYRVSLRLNSDCQIVLDGGVNAQTIGQLCGVKPYAVAVGSVFCAGQPYQAVVDSLRKAEHSKGIL